MAPTKRSRPAFSPPRPGKSKRSTPTTNTKGNKRASAGSRPSNSVGKNNTASKGGRKKSRQNMVLVDSEAESDSSEEQVEEVPDEDSEDAGDSGDENEEASEGSHPENEDNPSPEPSVILAEVTHDGPSITDQHPIPIPLLHRLLHHHFADKERTKMSTDAREVVGKYIEVFVREAIMRSSFENSARNASGAGWLEVEDLERTAVQLCLDF